MRESRRFTVRIPADLTDQLTRIARRTDRTFTAVLIRALRYGLPRCRPRLPRRPMPPLPPATPAPEEGADQ